MIALLRRHLRPYRVQVGVVVVRTEGRHRYYRADRSAFGAMAPMLERMWDDALWRLKLAAELEQARRGPKARRGTSRRATRASAHATTRHRERNT